VKVTEKPDGTIEVDTGRGAAKSVWDGETIAVTVLKADDERRYTLDVAYPADKADAHRGMDKHRDFASKAVVEDAAWNYMRNYRAVGMCHTPEQAASVGTPLLQDGAAELVESYVYRGPDWTVKAADGSEQVIKAGDWLVGFIWTPGAWEAIKSGKIGGVSVEGGAKRRKPSREALANLRD
jgi:Putative phage serine protease XkdF